MHQTVAIAARSLRRGGHGFVRRWLAIQEPNRLRIRGSNRMRTLVWIQIRIRIPTRIPIRIQTPIQVRQESVQTCRLQSVLLAECTVITAVEVEYDERNECYDWDNNTASRVYVSQHGCGGPCMLHHPTILSNAMALPILVFLKGGWIANKRVLVSVTRAFEVFSCSDRIPCL